MPNSEEYVSEEMLMITALRAEMMATQLTLATLAARQALDAENPQAAVMTLSIPLRSAAECFDTHDALSKTAREAIEKFADDLEARALEQLN